MTYIAWSSDFALSLHDHVIYDFQLLDNVSVWPNVWPQNKRRSLWSIFHGPVILPCSFKNIWYMNIILWDYETIWPQNKYMLLWPIFHGPVSLPYIFKAMWYMNIILWDYESVWPDVWPQNKCSLLWLIFHGTVILPYILKTIDVWTLYFGMSQSVPTFNPKMNVCFFYLYFMVQWFCLVSSRPCNVWLVCKSLWPLYMSQYDPTFDPVILSHIFKTMQYLNIILWNYETVWPDVWPQNKPMFLWPIFHGLVIFASYL